MSELIERGVEYLRDDPGFVAVGLWLLQLGAWAAWRLRPTARALFPLTRYLVRRGGAAAVLLGLPALAVDLATSPLGVLLGIRLRRRRQDVGVVLAEEVLALRDRIEASEKRDRGGIETRLTERVSDAESRLVKWEACRDGDAKRLSHLEAWLGGTPEEARQLIAQRNHETVAQVEIDALKERTGVERFKKSVVASEDKQRLDPPEGGHGAVCEALAEKAWDRYTEIAVRSVCEVLPKPETL